MLSPNHPNLDPNRRLSTSFSPPHSSDRMGYDSRSSARTECTRGSITCWMSDAANRIDSISRRSHGARRRGARSTGRGESRRATETVSSTATVLPPLRLLPLFHPLLGVHARFPTRFTPLPSPLHAFDAAWITLGGGFSSRRRGVPREKKLSRNLDWEFLVIFFICWNDKSEDGWLWYGELVPF